jgi:hypothetical protein
VFCQEAKQLSEEQKAMVTNNAPFTDQEIVTINKYIKYRTKMEKEEREFLK